jgi:probable rRNA maturation factor
MIRLLCFRNRQRRCCLDTRLLRRLVLLLLEEFLNVSEFELGVHFVASREMAKVNEAFLTHEGSTDVITFNHADRLLSNRSIQKGHPKSPLAPPGNRKYLHGELYICPNEALAQSRRFRTIWQAELVRYIIHGLLHLCGHDDLQPAARRMMKREENKLVREISNRFDLRQIGTRRKARGK